MPGLRSAISEPRFGPYLAFYGGREDLALRLYAWNATIADALWGPIGVVEVVVRNAIHGQLAERAGRPDWWEDKPLWSALLSREQRGVEDALTSLTSRGMGTPTGDDVVAAASLGLWTGLLSEGKPRDPLHNYEGNLWRPRLRRGFPNYVGSRKALFSELMEIKDIRNRVAHHEPVFKVNVYRIVGMVARVAGYVSADAEAFIRTNERVPAIADAKQAFVTRGETFI
jgi:hypothetical protein